MHVPALHDSVDGQWAPVSLPLTKGERRDFTLCSIDSIERFVWLAVGDKGDDLQGLICIYRDVILARSSERTIKGVYRAKEKLALPELPIHSHYHKR